MFLNSIKALIFDFDGVIVDSYSFSKSIFLDLGFNISDEDFKLHHDGNPLEKPILPSTNGRFGIRYESGILKMKSFFTTEEMLNLSKKYRLFIISSNHKNIITKFLDHNMINFFEEILGCDFDKSKVRKLKYLINNHQFTYTESIFISDTLGDIREANQVGIKNTIAVSYGYHDSGRLSQAKPLKTVDSPENLIKLLSK